MISLSALHPTLDLRSFQSGLYLLLSEFVEAKIFLWMQFCLHSIRKCKMFLKQYGKCAKPFICVFDQVQVAPKLLTKIKL